MGKSRTYYGHNEPPYRAPAAYPPRLEPKGVLGRVIDGLSIVLHGLRSAVQYAENSTLFMLIFVFGLVIAVCFGLVMFVRTVAPPHTPSELRQMCVEACLPDTVQTWSPESSSHCRCQSHSTSE